MKESLELNNTSKKIKQLKADIVKDIRTSFTERRKENTDLRLPEGSYFRIIIRPRELFSKFRAHNVSQPGGVQKISGKQFSGHWSTHAWLIRKSAAHKSKGKLIGDTKDAKHLLRSLGSKIAFIEDDVLVVK